MADGNKDSDNTPQEIEVASGATQSAGKGRVQRPDDPWPIDPYTESGIFLARHLNELVDSLDGTNFVGAATFRPNYLTAGGLWTQQLASGKVSLWMYTGSVDILVSDTDGIGTDQIDMTELTEYFQANLEFGVTTFNTRKGDVLPAEGDYDLVMLGDVNISSLTKDDMLQFNGTSWENNPPKLIDTELNFAGPVNPAVTAPAAKHADIYIADRNGLAHPTFIGIAGQNVRTGNALGFSTNHNANGDKVPDGTGAAWFLLGDVFSAGVTSIGSGSGISVNSSTPASPVVSIDRTTTDAWYQAKGNYEPAFSKNTAFNKNFGTSAGTVAEGNHLHSNYALSGHNHSGVYSPVGHTHTEYEPKFNKNTAFNKNFGSGYNDVPRGDHTHASTGVGAHNQSASTITAGTFASNSVYTFQSGLNLGDRLNVTYIDASNVIRSKLDVIAYYTSDRRLKDNIKPIDNALDKVLSLQGCEYDWNDKQDIYEGHDYSVIAQDVEAVFPELVREQSNGYKGVKIEKLIAPMIEAMRELSEEVRTLKARVADLEGDE